MSFEPHSRNWLTPHDLPRFTGDTLFDRVARTIAFFNEAFGCWRQLAWGRHEALDQHGA